MLPIVVVAILPKKHNREMLASQRNFTRLRRLFHLRNCQRRCHVNQRVSGDHTSNAVQIFLKGFSFLLGVGSSLAFFATVSVASGREGRSSKKKLQDEEKHNKETEKSSHKQNLERAVTKSLLQLEQIKEESGSPGLVCAVSVNGELVLDTGLGFCDVENGVKCHSGNLMRIASISKALTSIALGKLLQGDKITLDEHINEYVDYFPEKHFEGENVKITVRQLMSHTSGIRHYEKMLPKKKEPGNGHYDKETDEMDKKQEESAPEKTKQKSQENDQPAKKEGKGTKGNENKSDEFKKKEYYIKDHYKTIKEAVELFKEDPLLKKPGTDYLYTTHGWTLLSAVIEKASGMDYVSYMKNMCYDLGLDETMIELNDPLIYNRSRYYIRDSKGKLQNTPYVDNSYKWAGGGFLSTVGDLTKVGNIMLYCYQDQEKNDHLEGYLSKGVVDKLWTPEPITLGKVSKRFKEMGYGLGWQILPNSNEHGYCRKTEFAALHTGGAIGASSVLLIVPSAKEECCVGSNSRVEENSNSTMEVCSNRNIERDSQAVIEADSNSRFETNSKSRNPAEAGSNSRLETNSKSRNPVEADSNSTFETNSKSRNPRGIVVAIIVNMQEIGLTKTAIQIANNFKEI